MMLYHRRVATRALKASGITGLISSLFLPLPSFSATTLWWDTSYQQRVDFDLYYINNWSLGLDLLILLRTIPAVISRDGAY